MREVYRTEKKPLYDFAEQQDKQLVLFILYIDKTYPTLTSLKQNAICYCQVDKTIA